MTTPDSPRSRLRTRDLLPTGTLGLRSRRVRALLSGLGIAIGIASVVSVIGLTRSSQSHLLAQIDQLGTNLLTVGNGTDSNGAETRLPTSATPMIRQIPAVRSVAPTAKLSSNIYRNDRVPAGRTGGRAVRACDASLLATLDGSLLTGTFLDAGPYPVTVLGYQAATTLGIDDVSAGPRVWLGNHWYTVVGILTPFPLAPEIDQSALVSFASAEHLLGYDGHPSRLYLRTDPERVTDVAGLLAGTANPVDPARVEVSRPSEVLTAQLAVKEAGAGLFLGLSAIALLVGAIGIANVMVISVLERRTEIGLRRALGATRGHVAAQFLTEALVLSTLGGGAGIAVGTGVTTAISVHQGWIVLIPPGALWGATAVSVAAGMIAGLYPALRAANVPPTDALRTS
ncbi:ABC transporter permease [Plantactinospora soyae]|uniref:ABC transport system permease protein n=1 Tax=Plantactinospora soyae TaxID=1544732 RepID=A0A927MBY5_9ACTN|nr:ABC transporter permease [Plantactinospora soyae]MBE1490790.1 putative ABC transport system permease protein [Plantactinospora soyae]